MAKPVMTPKCRALQMREKTESVPKRTSKMDVWNQVNQRRVKKPMYEDREFLSSMGWLAVKVAKLATKKRS